MKLNQLDGMLTFVSVAQKRSFVAAAAALEVSSPAVSQTVKQLEERLGVRLLNRTTRSVALTEAGERFLARIGPALTELTEAMAELDAYREGPTGLLRINTSHIVWQMLLRHIVPGFLAEYPNIKVEMQLEDGFVDIVGDGFDVGVRLGESVQRDMIAVPLTKMERACMVASPQYVARYGAPESIEALHKHACIRYRFNASGMIYRWELMRKGQLVSVEVDGPLTVSDSRSMAEAARDGVGIAYTFERQVADELASGSMQAILPQCWPSFSGFSLYYPSRRQVPAKLRAFVEYCRKNVK